MNKHFTLAVDTDGIALITMDSPGRSMNVLGPEVETELAAIVDKIVADAAVRGAIITSGKPSFLAGYDLTEFLRSFGPQLSAVEVFEKFTGLGRLLRRIETIQQHYRQQTGAAVLAPLQRVALSATVSNAEEFGAWLETVRGET